MFNLLGKNAFARKRKASKLLIDDVSCIESLEDRVVPASQIFIDYDPTTGNLVLTGSGDDDIAIIVVDATNGVSLTTTGNFTGDGTGLTAGPFNVTGNLTISLGNGADGVSIDGDAGPGTLSSGNIYVDLGSGNDLSEMSTTNPLTVQGNVTVIGGTGDDAVTLGDGVAGAFVAQNVTIDLGTDAGVGQPITMDNFTVNGNLSINNAGTGNQVTQLGFEAPSTVNGNLSVTQSNSANTLGYIVDIRDVSVTGNVSVINGSGTGTTLARIQSLVPTTVGGTTTLINGNNATNVASIGFDPASSTLTLTKGIIVKNGTATTSNAINVNSAVNSGSTSATFTNGNAPTNSIAFGTNTANSFLGTVTATNGNATTTANLITVNRSTFAKATNFINGTALTTNTVTLGSIAAAPISVTGNLAITNGAATTSNNVNVDQLTTSGAKVGDVTINNAGTAATNVTFGATVANVIGGNLTIRNQATTGAKTTALDRTTVNGGVGAYIYNVGIGNSSVAIGTIAATSVTVAQTLKIEDGSGSSTLNLLAATIGTLNFSDIGGGADTINIATTAAKTVTVVGTTSLKTGAGSDTVIIGSAGTAIFNDSVFITLAAGTDSLTIGANAASPAFNTANKFQFDGGAGDDTISVSPLSIADYEPVLPGKKLRFKITNFEHLS